MNGKPAEVNGILSSLDSEQRNVVLHGAGPALVLAGPGSGKTRAITHRMAYLLASGQALPQEILALAFTNKAAEEMRERIMRLAGEGPRDVWISTFHSLCLHLLRQHGEEIGLPPHFVVFDEMAQEEALITALGEAGWYRYSTVYDLEELRSYITWQKSQISQAAEAAQEHGFASIAQRYQEILARQNALDFDDLILRAVELLWKSDEVRQALQARWKYVFVDEYHDISPSQYALLSLLAPPPRANCMVVADEDQSIYGWRGAEPALIAQFEREYQPVRLELGRNYRSAGPIVAATQALISKAPHRQRRRSGIVAGPQVTAASVTHHLFQTPEDEAMWIVKTIGGLTGQGGYRPGDIAILYRTHRRGDLAEQALVQAHIPTQRVRRHGIFQHRGSEEVFRYLQLIHSFADPYFKAALNFPRVIADELTMLQLQSLARRDGLTLVELAREIHRYPEVSPLTRAAIRDFLASFREDLVSLNQRSADQAVESLFRVLERFRSPYSAEDRATLAGFAAYLDMAAESQSLRQALDQGKALSLVATPTLDAVVAAFLLQDTLRTYLGQESPVALRSPQGESPLNRLWIAQGPSPDPSATSEALDQATVVQVEEREAGNIRYSLTTQAWRLAQALLSSFESLDQSRFVVYDLETTGRSPHHDQIVEIAAVTLDRGRQVGPAFHTLVHPNRHISNEAVQVHGIHQEDVQDAPPIEAVLPRFLSYLGDAILAGHNVNRFDNAILDREMGRLLGRGLRHPTLDTLEVASRLFPHLNLSLPSLLAYFRLDCEVAHRAEKDVLATAHLLGALLAENRRQREGDALTEYLPLVALGTYAAGAPMREENELLRQAALRVIQRPGARTVLARLMEFLPPDHGFEASSYLASLERETPPPRAEDDQWQALKREWQERAILFTSAAPDPSLSAFLDYLVTALQEDTYRPDAGAVTLMTLHNAKGKEFPVVIITGVEEGELPYWTARAPKRLEEERRVLYVGMTRARERLYLTSVHEGKRRRRNPSRFLTGIPSSLIRRRYHY
ncbi:MAG: UvrD-helicase domain-containing protein [Anaerolineae bacterium]